MTTTIWTTYHRQEQVEQYHLTENAYRRLYDVNRRSRNLMQRNALNPAWSELVTLWHVWQNQLKSDLVGFNHYRRQFEPMEVKEGECQIFACEHFGSMTIEDQYAHCHDRYDFETLLRVMRADPENTPYINHLRFDHALIKCCCFLMTWQDFDRMCSWMFPLMERVQCDLIGLAADTNPMTIVRAWRDKAVSTFGEAKADYQMRTPSFLAERLIGVWIKHNLRVVNPEQ